MFLDGLIDQIMWLRTGRNLKINHITISVAVNKQLLDKSDITQERTGKVVTKLLEIPVTVSPRLMGLQANIDYTAAGFDRSINMYEVDKNIRRR